jgi:CAAX prenyl protease-like protein
MSLIERSAIPRTVPFALFMAFIGIEEAARILADKGLISFSAHYLYYLYPIKTLSVAAVLILFLPRCQEITLRDLSNFGRTTVSILVGLIVFILWINMDWQVGTIGKPQGFNPSILSDSFSRNALTLVRLAGAVIVVPVMEELFWRSFLIRYIIDYDFAKVPIGRFTCLSFLISAALFGMEHNFFLAGVMAGVAYNLLLYYTRSLSHCIIAHAVTNLALGIYVINTGKWYFW